MAIDKNEILREIRRLAGKNNGIPPGVEAFRHETGIRQSEWYPHTWLRWSEAQIEAGYAPTQLQTRMSDEAIIEKYVGLMRELKLNRPPVIGELKRKARGDKSFPSHSVFNRFGTKEKLMRAAAAYCQGKPELRDISAIFAAQNLVNVAAIRSSGELAVKIPVPPKTIHSIETDDPIGVEAYWHRRFANKRGEGEWFELSVDDVSAFKRWKRIV